MGKPAPTLYRTYADGSISGNRAHHSGAWPTHAPIGTWIAKLSSRTLLPRTRRSEEHPSELQSLMRISSAVFCLQQQQSLTYISRRYKLDLTTSILNIL